MDIASFTQRESMLCLRELLLSAEEDRANGEKGYSIDETVVLMKEASL